MELCPECHAGCCRRFNVYVLGSDIIRICESLKMDMSVFVNPIPLPADKIEKYRFNNTAIFMYKDGGEGQYYCLALKSDFSKFYPETTKCIFLQEFNAEILSRGKIPGTISRCGIYGCRPAICRAFPATYYDEEKQIKIKDPHLVIEKAKAAVQDSPAYNLCARGLTEEDYVPFVEGYVKDAVLEYYESEFFCKVAEKWNNDPDLFDNFYDFLLKEYNNRIEYMQK